MTSPTRTDRVQITLDSQGHGTLTFSDTVEPITGPDLQTSRRDAKRRVLALARDLGEAVQFGVEEPDGAREFCAWPDGRVSSATPPTETTRSDTTPDTLDRVANASDDPRWTEIMTAPATQGFRGTLNSIGMKLSPTSAEIDTRRKDLEATIATESRAANDRLRVARQDAEMESRREAREREALARRKAQRAVIQTNFADCKTVTFANWKGGVGKTTDTYCIGATFGRIRGNDVVAWDANETRGTLGFRAMKDRHSRTVVNLLEDAASDFGTVQGSRRSTIMRFARQQGDNQFSVIASDEDAERQDIVDGDGFRTVHEILARFNSLILIDTGNNGRVAHFKAAIDATDQLVIPVSAGADGASVAQAMMDSFDALGHDDLVRNAVVLLHDSATRRGDARGIAEQLGARVRTVIGIPFDPALDTGDEIDFDALAATTRAAYQEAAAAIARSLADSTTD